MFFLGKHSPNDVINFNVGNDEDPSSDHDQEVTPEEGYLPNRKFPSLEQQDNEPSPALKGITVQELIAER